MGVARSASPLGPFVKQPQPVLHSNKAWAGPGHCSVVSVHNTTAAADLAVPHLINDNNGNSNSTQQWAMVYHAWQEPNVGGPHNSRMLMMDAVVWDAVTGWPAIATSSPSVGPRPVPT